MKRGRRLSDKVDVLSHRSTSNSTEFYRYGCGLVALLVALSFLPHQAKVMLHTRGVLHTWMHVYLFAGACALLLERRAPWRGVLQVVGGLILLALAIESVQARFCLAYLELPDVGADVFGVLAGWLVGWLRASRTASGRRTGRVRGYLEPEEVRL